MTTREVLIDLNGRVNPNLKKNLRDTEAGLRAVQIAARGAGGRFEDAGQSVEGFAEDLKTLTRLQTSGRNSINRYSRQLRALNAQYEGAKKGSDEYKRLGRRIETTNQNLRLQRGILDDVEDRLQRVRAAGGRAEKSVRRLAGVRLEGLRTKLIGVATAFVSLQTVQQTRQEFERLNQVLRDAPQLDFGQARQLLRASELIGFDEGSIADVANEFNIRLGEAIADPASRREFTDAISAIGLDMDALRAQAPTQQIQTLTKALRGVNDVANRSALADFIAGGQGGQALNFLAANADAASLAFAELNRMPVITPDTQKRLAQFNADTARIGHSIGDLRSAFVASGFQSVVGGLADGVSYASRAVAVWAQENRGAALGIGAIVAVTPTAISALADYGGGALQVAANFSVVTDHLSLFAGAVPAVAKAATSGKAGFLALAGGIKTAAAASWAFAVSPTGLVIISIGAAVAGVAAAVTLLADKFGGFGRLWDITLAGAKAAFLSWAQGVTLGLRPIAAALDALIVGINAVSAGLSKIPGVDLGQIDFRAGSAFAALDDAAGAARADFQRQTREGLAEGRRQQAAGTSVGQRLGGAIGFGGGQAPGPATAPLAQAPPDAPIPASAARRAPQVVESASTNNYINAEIHVSIANADDWERAGELVRENLLQRPFAAAGR